MPSIRHISQTNFYPRSPCGERRGAKTIAAKIGNFYPRSPCGERRQQPDGTTKTTYFYPRSPCGERRNNPQIGRLPNLYFYPRSPCGERQAILFYLSPQSVFLSTLSLRRATRHIIYCVPYARLISIHALLAESDWLRQGSNRIYTYFYPRSPCGERQKL